MADENQVTADQQPQDIYPLGQGGGLMRDALNFVLNNVYQYGQGLGKQSAQLDKTLSGMAAGDPNAQLPAISSMMPSLAPNIVGQISPQAWASYGPEAKAALTPVFNKFPELFKKVQQVPQDLMTYAVERANMPSQEALGTLSRTNPYLDSMHLLNEPKRPFSGNYGSPQEGTVIHELQHHMNRDRVGATDPADAGTIALLLKDLMYNKPIESLNVRAKQLGRVLGEPAVGMTPMPRNPYLVNKGTYNFVQDAPVHQFTPRAAMDEGLAYLAENSVGDSVLSKLAAKLGIGPGPIAPNFVPTAPPRPATVPGTGGLLADEVWKLVNQLRGR